MKKVDILKQLIQTEAFTSNKAAKEMLEKAITFVKKA